MSKEDELLYATRSRTTQNMMAAAMLDGSPSLQRRLTRNLQDILTAIDEHTALQTSVVTPEVLADDVIDACALEGWDVGLTFWDHDNPRYGSVDDESYADSDPNYECENPSESAARIAHRLLERYEMRPRT